MSAIWGAIDLDKHQLPEQLNDRMQLPFQNYAIDKFDYIKKGHLLMGTGLQFITSESLKEQLPYYEEVNQIYITADCIIDNRSELIAELNQPNRYNHQTTDSQLILGSFIKWRENCAMHLRGLFSFAIYETDTNTVYLYTDQLSERILYYSMDHTTLLFSTLLKPIVTNLKNKAELNETYIADSLAIFGLGARNDASYTPYNNISTIEAGCYVKVTSSKMSQHRYWSIGRPKVPYEFTTAEKAGMDFVDVMTAAVSDAIRTNGKVAASLSGGLDSSTIGCIAASLLSKAKKDLFTYTFTPLKEYVHVGNDLQIPDESNKVKLMQKKYPNMVQNFLSNEGSNPFGEIKDINSILETPYKSVCNMPNVYSLFKGAGQDNCKILLIGHYGNATISLGKPINDIYHYFKRFQWVKCIQAIDNMGNAFPISRKKVLMWFIKHLAKYHVLKLINSSKSLDYQNLYINKGFAVHNNVEERLDAAHKGISSQDFKDINTYRKNMYNTNLLSQIGENNTKFSLKSGLIVRDPAKDIRILDFCYQLEISCYINKGVPRWLVRGNLKDYVPAEILENTLQRGMQGADCEYRLKKDWDGLYDEFRKICSTPELLKYIDQDKVAQFFDENKDAFDSSKRHAADPLLHLASLGYFLEEFSHSN